MRGILLLSAMLLAAGGAAASVPAQPTLPERTPSPSMWQLSGSVFLQERPLPGTTLHYPGMFTPLRGPHGGLLASRHHRVVERG